MRASEARVGYIDSLRGIAATAVFLQHSVELAAREEANWFLALGPGVFGVALFFFLSGFVMPFSVAKNPSLIEFVTRRLARIYPAYLVTICMVAVLGWALIPELQTSFNSGGVYGIVANILLVQEFVGAPPILGVSWTLSLEFIWYGVFAVIFYGLGWNRLVRAHALFCSALLALSLVSVITESRVPLGRVSMLGAALTGCVAAQWRRGQVDSRTLAKSTTLFAVACGTGLWVAFGHFAHFKVSLASVVVAWSGAFVLFFGAVISTRHNGVVADALHNPALLAVGRTSYSLYLVHGLALAVGHFALHLAGPTLVVSAWLSSLVAAYAMYRLVEQPGISGGAHIAAILRDGTWGSFSRSTGVRP
jgi:peptidoglycan/LPS O-acetylase OafA/YrhL